MGVRIELDSLEQGSFSLIHFGLGCRQLGQQNGGFGNGNVSILLFFSFPGDQDARPSHVDFGEEKLRLGGLGIFVNLRLNPGKSIGVLSFGKIQIDELFDSGQVIGTNSRVRSRPGAPRSFYSAGNR